MRLDVAAVLEGDDFAVDPDRRFRASDKIAITSENVLDPVLKRLDDPHRCQTIAALKDKSRCREMLSTLYPDFYFKRATLDELDQITLPPDRTFVIKPNKGYFATAIKYVTSETDLREIRDEITDELKRKSEIFADTVLSDNEVIIEAFIEGEEYAVDMFFTSDGEPAIVNIYHHPIPENPDYLHALYYSSKPVFDALHDRFVDWFRTLNKTLKATSFPIHGEFRLTETGISPIELNPLRFGGDGLIDLAYHAFGLNPYDAFFKDQAPDWDALWKGREEKIFTWMMGYVGTDVDVASHRPDMGRFQNLFTKVLSDTMLDYQSSMGFSVIYAEETDMEAVHHLVNLEFREFFLGSDKFSDAALSQLYRSGVRIEFDPHETIWHEGDFGDYVLLIITGALDVVHGQNGSEVHLDTLGPKSAVGEFTVMDGRPRSATVRAGPGGCLAMKINGSAFRSVLRQSPDLFEELYWQQQTRIRRMNHRLGELEERLRQAERESAAIEQV